MTPTVAVPAQGARHNEAVGLSLRRSAPRPQDEVRTLVRWELLRFAVPAVGGVVLLGVAALVVSVALARQQSQENALLNAQWLARSVVQPHLSDGLVHGRTGAIVTMDRAFDTTVNGSQVVDARIWNADGVMIYSDDPRLVGESFDTAALPLPDAGSPAAPIDLALSENRYLAPATEYVQVVLPVEGAGGRTYTFQMVQRQDSVQQSAREIWVTFVPILLGSLLLVGVLLALLAVRMARRLSAALRHRQDLLQHAVDASELERRRIAADLHDGTVQRLAGVGYSLSGLSRRAARQGDAEQSRALGDRADEVRDSVRDLRSLLVDIYPPNVERTGLHLALADVASSLAPGVTVALDVEEDPAIGAQLQATVYRIGREAMINAAHHSGADLIDVSVRRTGTDLVLRVVDHGTGFDPGSVPDDHFGLTILRDLAESVGGELSVSTAPGRGTTVEFRVAT